jgi:hypothetical protein
MPVYEDRLKESPIRRFLMGGAGYCDGYGFFDINGLVCPVIDK